MGLVEMLSKADEGRTTWFQVLPLEKHFGPEVFCAYVQHLEENSNSEGTVVSDYQGWSLVK